MSWANWSIKLTRLGSKSTDGRHNLLNQTAGMNKDCLTFVQPRQTYISCSPPPPFVIYLDGRLVENLAPTHEDLHEKLVVFHIYLSENFRQISEKDTHIYLKSNAIDSNEFVGDEKKILRQIVFRIQGVGYHTQCRMNGREIQISWSRGGKMMTITKQTGVRWKKCVWGFLGKNNWCIVMGNFCTFIHPNTLQKTKDAHELITPKSGKNITVAQLGKLKKRPNKKHDPKNKTQIAIPKSVLCLC